MNANEIIDCQLREDGLHVTAYRHKGVCVASCVSFGKEHKINMNIGERKSLDEDALKELAEEKILPWIKQVLDPRFNEIEVPIILSICDMSIENELPNRMV